MKKGLLAALLAAASLAALASAADSPPHGFTVPAGAEVRAKEVTPLLGTRWNERARRRELVHVDPVSLTARTEPVLAIGKHGSSWGYSPDGDRLAVTAQTETRRGFATSLYVVEPETLRRRLALPLGPSEVWALAWLEPDRIVLVRHAYHPERLEAVAIAPSARRVIATTALSGELMAVERTRDALVLLLAPPGRIGPAKLAVVSANAEVRFVELERVWIGVERPDSHAEDFVARMRHPGFAADPDGRAFVFPAGSDAAEIDLRTLAVSYHAVSEPVSLFERLHRFVDPVATAKAIDGPSRSARWLGGGLVAVTGVDYATWKDRESRLQASSSPAGLMVVDTSTWRARMIDRGATAATFADGLLVATGGACNSETKVCTSMGLAAYGLDGERRYRLFPERPVFVLQAFRGLGYVSENDEAVRVVDLASGRVVGTRRDAPPWLLLDGASSFGGG